MSTSGQGTIRRDVTSPRHLRAAVIGVGRMGAHHARIAAESGDVDLVAVADVSADAAREIARRYNASWYGSASLLLERERPDIVAVAVPTEQHRTVAAEALRAGAHVLVEKPIAADPRTARELLRVARVQRRKLCVGHVERFNPAVQELRRRLRRKEAGRVLQIHAQRFSPPVRTGDAGVLLDLGTHDLDVMRFLLAREARTVTAVMRRHTHPRHEDLVVATVQFADGVVGVLEVNWLTPIKVRTLSVLGTRGLFTVDYITQDLVFHESAVVHGRWEARDLVSGGAEGKIERIPIAHVEPLRAEWAAFVALARGGRSRIVAGDDALLTLELAAAAARSARTGRAVSLRARA